MFDWLLAVSNWLLAITNCQNLYYRTSTQVQKIKYEQTAIFFTKESSVLSRSDLGRGEGGAVFVIAHLIRG